MNLSQLSTKRDAVVELATELAAALDVANGDSPDLAHEVREQLMARLRALSLVLWSHGHCE
jgi:VIT1/CCC1 family predicted Fe2+/Mn2+ transporter